MTKANKSPLYLHPDFSYLLDTVIHILKNYFLELLRHVTERNIPNKSQTYKNSSWFLVTNEHRLLRSVQLATLHQPPAGMLRHVLLPTFRLLGVVTQTMALRLFHGKLCRRDYFWNIKKSQNSLDYELSTQRSVCIIQNRRYLIVHWK